MVDESQFKLFDDLSSELVSYWKTQTIYSGVKLGVFKIIGHSSLNLDQLANKIEINIKGLKRLIRALCALELLKISSDKISLTEKGKFFLEDHEYTLAPATIHWAEEHYYTWGNIVESIREGREIFTDIYGKPYFSWLEDNAIRAYNYQKAMESYAKRDYQFITDVYNFSNIKCLMDVGGGSGILLDYILEKNHKIKGILFEQKKSIKAAKASKLKNKLNRCEFISGDFFNEIPRGSDGIILARILHDWDDKEANIILQNCNVALNINDKLFLVELILPSDMNNSFGGLLSLNMLALTGGKERTKEEFETLLNSNGFELTEIRKLNSVSSLIITSKIKCLR